MHKFLFLTLFTFLFSQAEITNIQASQRTDGSQIVDITYDLLEDDLFENFTVIAEYSIDNGLNFSNLNFIYGDIGELITSGLSKSIVWEMGEQLPNIYFENVIIKITAESSIVSEYPFELLDVPAGEYPDNCGMGYPDILDYDYRIMENAVTNAQYAEFLIMLLDNGQLNSEMGLEFSTAYYDGDAYLEPGDYSLIEYYDDNCGITDNGTTFIVNEGEGNLPAGCITWVGAKIFADYFGLRLPLIQEYQKAFHLNLLDTTNPQDPDYCDGYNTELTNNLSSFENGYPTYYTIGGSACSISAELDFDQGACYAFFRLVTTN